jgi:predicted TIM-barrel fold metal-dependent hydrolase
VIIDCHNHVLGSALMPGHAVFRREMGADALKAAGKLPVDRPVTSEDWEGLEDVWQSISPESLIADHQAAGVARSVILSVAPSDYTAYGQRGTVDLDGVTDIDGPPSILLANDYIASLARNDEHFLGVAAVNPRFRGVSAAQAEITRAKEELRLLALKLYPMYDRYRIDDDELSVPMFDAAAQLNLPVMIHMGTSPARDTTLAFAHPLAVDEVAKKFPQLPILICHSGYPWTDDCLAVAGRNDNVYLDVSYFISKVDPPEIYDFLQKARRFGCSWSRICWGTDYPGAGRPQELLPKFGLVGDLDRGGDPVSDPEMALMLGGNWARFAGVSGWSESDTLAELFELKPRWRQMAFDSSRATGTRAQDPLTD